MKKLLRELKWFLVSAAVVGLALGSIYSVAVFCQWRIDGNVAKVDTGEIEMVGWNEW